MRFRVTVSCAVEADTAEDALYLYRDAHCYGRLEGLDRESQEALADVPDEDGG